MLWLLLLKMSHFNSPKPNLASPFDKKIIEVCKSLKILKKEYRTHKKSQISRKQKMKILMTIFIFYRPTTFSALCFLVLSEQWQWRVSSDGKKSHATIGDWLRAPYPQSYAVTNKCCAFLVRQPASRTHPRRLCDKILMYSCYCLMRW